MVSNKFIQLLYILAIICTSQCIFFPDDPEYPQIITETDPFGFKQILNKFSFQDYADLFHDKLKYINKSTEKLKPDLIHRLKTIKRDYSANTDSAISVNWKLGGSQTDPPLSEDVGAIYTLQPRKYEIRFGSDSLSPPYYSGSSTFTIFFNEKRNWVILEWTDIPSLGQTGKLSFFHPDFKPDLN